MSLFQQTFILFVGMAVFSALPAFLPKIDSFSRTLFLVGTGAITGLCAFDLLPDAFELGGGSSLYVIGGVWFVYSIGHFFHLGHHHHEGDASGGIGVFFASIFAHCFSSGMLLALSRSFSQKIAGAVFIALVAHKGYEALMVSTVLRQRVKHPTTQLGLVILYSLALPMGVGCSFLFQDSWSRSVAILVSSIALGTLLGCVVFDFLIPSVEHLKKARLRVGWILAGLVVTQIIVKRL